MEDTTIEVALKTFQDYYVKKDYKSALQTLQSHQSKLPRGLLHYNLGTVYGKLENWPLARYHLLMAEKNGFDSRELEQNKKLVEERLDVVRLEKPLNAMDYGVKFSTSISGEVLTTLGLIILLVGMLFLKKKPSLMRALVLILLVLSPLCLNWWISTWPRSIATEPQAILEGPSGIFSAKGELMPGTLVISLDKGQWQEIIWPSRFSGWVKRSALKELE